MYNEALTSEGEIMTFKAMQNLIEFMSPSQPYKLYLTVHYTQKQRKIISVMKENEGRKQPNKCTKEIQKNSSILGKMTISNPYSSVVIFNIHGQNSPLKYIGLVNASLFFYSTFTPQQY